MGTESVHVLGFAGSLRRDSYNRALLRAAHELLPEGLTLETFDLDSIPLFNSDLELPEPPAAVRGFRERLAAADAVLIVSPEYNQSIPGVLKNAIDWASRRPSPLADKPAAICGASTGGFGTVRSQQHLRLVLAHIDLHVLNKPELMVSLAKDKFDADGRLTDERTRQSLRALLDALRLWTLRLRP